MILLIRDMRLGALFATALGTSIRESVEMGGKFGACLCVKPSPSHPLIPSAPHPFQPLRPPPHVPAHVRSGISVRPWLTAGKGNWSEDPQGG